MAWRTHRHTMRLLEDWSRDRPEARRFPPVIVLLLYHGVEECTAELGSLIVELRPDIPTEKKQMENRDCATSGAL